MANTHYAVLAFSGDPANEHPDEELRGHGPQLTLIAMGDEDFCWQALTDWTRTHPLRLWEEAEVLERHPSFVQPIGEQMKGCTVMMRVGDDIEVPEAADWETNDRGELLVLGGDGRAVACFAGGAWVAVKAHAGD